MVSDLGVFGTGIAPRWLDVVEALGWTQGVVNFSRKVFGSWDTCHHRGHCQILTTTGYSIL